MPQILHNHTSMDTAYLVEDYPYGFRLRCQIRYWLEYRKGHGYRLMSQTSNPKKPGLVWNKPKASTYSHLGVMFLDDAGHVQWDGLSLYRNRAELEAFYIRYDGGSWDAPQQTIYNVMLAWDDAYQARKNARLATA
jgi:hypothetical protein